VVGAAMSVIVDYDRFGDLHTYEQITGDGYLTTHDPQGSVLYGVDVFVHPEYRDLRLGRRLYDARKELCRNLNLQAIIVGARIPGYRKYKERMSPEQYIELVKRKEIRDPILSFQLANDFHVRRVITGYLPEDQESDSYAVLLEWNNIWYRPKKDPLIGARRSVVRVGTVQWQMRPVGSIDGVLTQVEFFIDALAGYKADFALFPEFFNAPLMAQFNQGNPAEAIRGLARFTEPMVEQMRELAVAYNINIIAGSMPVYQDQQLYNVAYLLHRDGRIEHQYKLHVTPDEVAYWGMRGGEQLRIFETDVGKIGILICYDVEFPELSRILSEKGVQILFVPTGPTRATATCGCAIVRQARAIEKRMLRRHHRQRRQSATDREHRRAVFALGRVHAVDFSFDRDAIAAETTPNTEMTLVVDLDLDKLTQLRQSGTVRNYLNRRRDLYHIQWLGE